MKKKEKPPNKVAPVLAVIFLVLQIIDKLLEIVQKLVDR